MTLKWWQTALLILGLMGLSLVMRILPHPANWTPLAAAALFIGREVRSKLWAFALPIFILILSDAVIGFYPACGFNYLCFGLGILLGSSLRGRGFGVAAAASVANSLVFFVLSNFGVWMFGSLYSKSFAGLVECYAMALPFLRNSVAGDLFFVAIFFGMASWVKNRQLLSADEKTSFV